MTKFVRLAALAAAATLVATPAVAAPVAASPKAKATAKIVKPLTLVAQRDLDFGTIVVGLAVGGTRTITVSAAGVLRRLRCHRRRLLGHADVGAIST